MFILFFMHQAYGDSSFQDCKRASEEAMAMIIKNLQVYSSFPIKHMDRVAMDVYFHSYCSSIFFGHIRLQLEISIRDDLNIHAFHKAFGAIYLHESVLFLGVGGGDDLTLGLFELKFAQLFFFMVSGPQG